MPNTRFIILIEDNPNDAKLAELTLLHAALANPIKHMQSPEEALAFLLECGDQWPILILLDLGFPGHMDGYDFIRELHNHRPSWGIPIIIFTSRKEDEDENVGLGLHGYIDKPITAEKLLASIKTLRLKWQVIE